MKLARDDIERTRALADRYAQPDLKMSTGGMHPNVPSAYLRDLCDTALDAMRERDDARAEVERLANVSVIQNSRITELETEVERLRAGRRALRDVLEAATRPMRPTIEDNSEWWEKAARVLAEGEK